MIFKEWQMVESQRDGSHAFKAVAGSEICGQCNKRRWAHLDDGHHPGAEHKYSFADTKYRPGTHPYWTRPGSFNKKAVRVDDGHEQISSHNTTTPPSVAPGMAGGKTRRFPVKPQSDVLIAPPVSPTDRVRIATAMSSDGPVKNSPGQGRIPHRPVGAEMT